MIKSFAGKIAGDLYNGLNTSHSRRLSRELHGKAQRLLDQINAATKVDTLKVPPGNRLEKLKGGLAEHWSLRINDQWRIIFKWKDGNAYKVEIIDYH